MQRRTFLAGGAAAATVALAGCSRGEGSEDEGGEYVDLSRVAIELGNNDTTAHEVQVLVESTGEHVHWATYEVAAGSSELIDVDVPDEQQFVAVQLRLDDEVYSADFRNWNDLEGSCGSLTLMIGDGEDLPTNLYYNTDDAGACSSPSADADEE